MSNRKLSFIIAFIYVIFGTFYSYYAMNNVISDGIIYYIFFPVSIIPQIILFTEREPFLYILICQIITLVITTLLIWSLMSVIRKKTDDKYN